MSKSNAYATIIEEIFASKFETGMTRVDFERADITAAAKRREAGEKSGAPARSVLRSGC